MGKVLGPNINGGVVVSIVIHTKTHTPTTGVNKMSIFSMWGMGRFCSKSKLIQAILSS